jgi:hypothetical protein
VPRELEHKRFKGAHGRAWGAVRAPGWAATVSVGAIVTGLLATSAMIRLEHAGLFLAAVAGLAATAAAFLLVYLLLLGFHFALSGRRELLKLRTEVPQLKETVRDQERAFNKREMENTQVQADLRTENRTLREQNQKLSGPTIQFQLPPVPAEGLIVQTSSDGTFTVDRKPASQADIEEEGKEGSRPDS